MKELFPIYSIGSFINKPESQTEFEINCFDDMEEPDVEELHKHNFYEILWVEKGSCRQIIDHKEYAVSDETLFFISPGQLHQFEEWQLIMGGTIMFTESFFLLNHQNKDKLFELSFLDNTYFNPCLKLNERNYSEIKHTIELLLFEKTRIDSSTSILQSLLHVLLSQIQRCIDLHSYETLPKKYIVLFKQFKSIIDTHFHQNLTVSDYSGKLNITPHHLNFITTQVTGKTATEVIRERSILEAKRLLTFTDYTISEIAAQLHYFDSSYFSKIFKAGTGTSPSDFKNLISDKYRIK